jgi:REP element-mobilizing transposase RayT
MRKASIEVWAYCLMPNHEHLILTPTYADIMSLYYFPASYLALPLPWCRSYQEEM